MGLLDKLLDAVFPQKCPYCGSLSDQKDGEPCEKCDKGLFLEGAQALVAGRNLLRCASVAWYREPLRGEFRRFKFRGQRNHAGPYGRKLARTIRFYLPGTYDVITWAPVSEKTLQDRGYDQARLLAESAAGALGTEAVPLLSKVKDTKAQSSLVDGEARFWNVKGAYRVPDPALVAGKRVLVIDDILTTGATLEEAAWTLKQAGAAQVVGATLCRTPK